MRKWIKRLGWMLSLPLALALGLVLWLGFKLLTYSQTDDAAHVASKAAYLKQIAAQAPVPNRPNVMLILYDDLGLGDLGYSGSRAIKTPNIDALARGGVVLNHYYAAAPVCTPSRAALLTGRLAPRAGLPNVVFPSDNLKRLSNVIPGDNMRLPAEEITLADMLGASGYRTAMVGKWHMGDTAPSLPRGFGFQSYFGALYSNDMEPFALYRDEKIAVPAPADQTRIDGLYTDEVVKQISSAKPGAPFFVYFAHNFPHIPLYAANALKGRSAAGLYGDIVEGLDDGVGRIVTALKASGQFDNTIIILTSDNGPWYEGSAGAMRGRKGQVYEGGVRVPFIVHWPKGLAGGRQIDDMAMGSDLVPTLLDWIGLPAPGDRMIDGKSLRAMLEGRANAAHDLLYFYSGKRLMAVSDGRFKYHAAAPYHYVISGAGFSLPSRQGPWLFDLSVDPDESYNVAMKYPQDAARLKAALDARNAEMASNPRGWKGKS